MNYFFVADGKQIGPVSIEELKMAELDSNSLVWFDGLADWTPLGELDELKKELFPSKPPSIDYDTLWDNALKLQRESAYNEAIEKWRLLMKVHPSKVGPAVHTNLSTCYSCRSNSQKKDSDRIDDLDTSIDQLSSALRITQDPQAKFKRLLYRGVDRFDVGDYDLARLDFSKAMIELHELTEEDMELNKIRSERESLSARIISCHLRLRDFSSAANAYVRWCRRIPMMLHISPWPARFNNVYGYYNDFLSDNFTEIEPCLDQHDGGPYDRFRQLVLSNKEVEHLRKAMWINRVEMSQLFNLGVTSIYKGYDEKALECLFLSLN